MASVEDTLAARGLTQNVRGRANPQSKIMFRVRFARIALLILTAVIIAWFALAAYQAREVTRADSALLAAGGLNPTQARHISMLLDRAGVLNPDRSVDLRRADVAARQGQDGRARTLLAHVIAQEPLNVEAWSDLAKLGRLDPRTRALAAKRVLELDPIG